MYFGTECNLWANVWRKNFYFTKIRKKTYMYDVNPKILVPMYVMYHEEKKMIGNIMNPQKNHPQKEGDPE